MWTKNLYAAHSNPVVALAAEAGPSIGTLALDPAGIIILDPAPVPVVTIHTIYPEALEADCHPGATNWDNLGVIEIRRAGDPISGLEVFFEVTGTAQRQDDYVLLPGVEWFPCGGDQTNTDFRDNILTIHAGASSLRLGVQARPDLIAEADETVVVTLLDDPRNIDPPLYRIGTPSQATVYVVERSGAMPLILFAQGDGQLQFVLQEGSLVQGQFELELSHDLKHWRSLCPFSPGNVAAFAQDTVPPDNPLPRFYRAALRR